MSKIFHGMIFRKLVEYMEGTAKHPAPKQKPWPVTDCSRNSGRPWRFRLNRFLHYIIIHEVSVTNSKDRLLSHPEAGFTVNGNTEETNQKLSEERANTVRDYLIEKGITAERITVIGYGRTKPALYEVSPGEINSPEAKANMRVLFEIVVK